MSALSVGGFYFVFCNILDNVKSHIVKTTITILSQTIFVSLEPVISNTGIFVAIDNNTLYGSKLYIFLLCQKSLGY